MPASHRRLLDPVIAQDAEDAWLRDAVMAYLRNFTRIFERGKSRQSAECALAVGLSALTGLEPRGDVDADTDAAEARLAPGFGERDSEFLGGRTFP
jgi:hypothetical protein